MKVGLGVGVQHPIKQIVSVARIEESDEEELEIASDEIAPDTGAIVETSELEKPADPAQE